MKRLPTIFSLALSLSLLTSCTGSKDAGDAEEVTSSENTTEAVSGGAPVNFTGKITFSGVAKKRKALRMSADPVCQKQHGKKKVLSESVIVGPAGELKNAVVYVSSSVPAGYKKGREVAPASLDQKGCIYDPHVMAVQTGQTIKIINSDPTLHNVNAQAKTNRSFNEGMASKGQVIEKKFTKPEAMIKIKCDVHGWMTSYVGVFKHPYFAVTDASGSFSIKDLPAGTYTVEVWHEKYGKLSESVTVSETSSKKDFVFSG